MNRYYIRAFFTLAICFSSLLIFSQSPPVLWLKGFGTTGLDVSTGSGIDSLGNVYTAGAGSNGADFDPGPGTYTIASGVFYISKIDSSGNFIWAIRFGYSTSFTGSTMKGMSVDASGNIYVSGILGNTLDFDPGPGTYTLTNYPNSAFVAKYNSSGNFLWARNFGGDAIINSMALDTSGSVYMTGSFISNADFDPGQGVYTLNSSGNNGDPDVFISKLDRWGNFIWAKNVGGVNVDEAFGISVDLSKNVYITGRFFGTADFDPGPSIYNLVATIAYDAFILKLDVQGDLLWAKVLNNGAAGDRGRNIAIDGSGNLYAIGQFSSTVDFDPGTNVNNVTSIAQDIFILKLDPSGNFIWVKSIASSTPYYITFDLYGKILISGYFTGTVDFDTGPGLSNYTSSGNADAFILELDVTGNMLWTRTYGGLGNDDCKTLSIDKSNNIYVNGIYYNNVVFEAGPGNFSLAAVGQIDFYVMKIGKCFSPNSPLITTLSQNQIICEGNNAVFSTNSPANINWYSTPVSVSILFSGQTYITPSLTNGTYTFYAEAYTCTNSVVRSIATVSVETCLGLSNYYQESSNNVFPNPSSGIYSVNITEKSKIIVNNIHGIKIKELNPDGQNFIIDLTEFPSGVYFFEFTDQKNKRDCIKVFKQ